MARERSQVTPDHDRVLGADRRDPGSDLHDDVPHVAQEEAVQTTAARHHLRRLRDDERAGPKGSMSAAAFVVLGLIVAAILAIAIGVI